MYRKITVKTEGMLTDIVGKDNILDSPEDMDSYARDESRVLYFPPEYVVRPSNEKQVREIIKLANMELFPVVARGGGTGLTGGALASEGGAVVSFELMNNITDIDTQNRMAVLQPGVINGVFQSQAEENGLFYPVNPASMDSCTLGGNVSNSTGGANTVRYGTTRNYICGMRAVNGNNEVLCAGGKVVKNSTDHTLIQLMCGSEGTLGFFTELTFRLIARPAVTAWIIALFSDIYRISETAGEIYCKGLNPTMMELMDSATLGYCRKYLEIEAQYGRYHQLLLRFDSQDKEELEKAVIKAGEMCMNSGADEVLVADSKIEQEKIWKIRSSIHDALINAARPVCEEDIVIPVSRVNELLKELYLLSDRYGYELTVFGHLGDGNMHVSYNARGEAGNIVPENTVEELRSDVFRKTDILGGKISGEHGIGLLKRRYWKKYVDPSYISLVSRIKKEFDSNLIINPGKLSD
ncbi:MAG: FAD-binding oxidoreductase [Elusimicrobiota bacterium]